MKSEYARFLLPRTFKILSGMENRFNTSVITFHVLKEMLLCSEREQNSLKVSVCVRRGYFFFNKVM